MNKKILILLLIFLLGYLLFFKNKEHISNSCNVEGMQNLCQLKDLDAQKIESIIRYNIPENMDAFVACMKENNVSRNVIDILENDHLNDFYSLKENFDCALLENIIDKIKNNI